MYLCAMPSYGMYDKHFDTGKRQFQSIDVNQAITILSSLVTELVKMGFAITKKR